MMPPPPCAVAESRPWPGSVDPHAGLCELLHVLSNLSCSSAFRSRLGAEHPDCLRALVRLLSCEGRCQRLAARCIANLTWADPENRRVLIESGAAAALAVASKPVRPVARFSRGRSGRPIGLARAKCASKIYFFLLNLRPSIEL